MDGLGTDLSIGEGDLEAYRGQLPNGEQSRENRERERFAEFNKLPDADIGAVASKFARPDDMGTELMPETDTA